MNARFDGVRRKFFSVLLEPQWKWIVLEDEVRLILNLNLIFEVRGKKILTKL
jgi:hypothetical protein